MNLEYLHLLNWRRAVFAMYAELRAAGRSAPDHLQAHENFRRQRDELFRRHPSSPLTDAQRAAFKGLRYYDYDPVWRTTGRFLAQPNEDVFDIPLEADGVLRVQPIGAVSFQLKEHAARLTIYKLHGYGGGLWLPFCDLTNGSSSYGGGRYLLDTIKGADLGSENDELLLDFNHAYNPSCAYNSQWVCPLSPPQNRLSFEVEAGERLTNFEGV